MHFVLRICFAFIKFGVGGTTPIKFWHASKYSLHSVPFHYIVSVPYIVPDVCHFIYVIFMSYSNWRGPKITYRL